MKKGLVFLLVSLFLIPCMTDGAYAWGKKKKKKKAQTEQMASKKKMTKYEELFEGKQHDIFAPEIKESLTIVFKQKRERAACGPFSFCNLRKIAYLCSPLNNTLFINL